MPLQETNNISLSDIYKEINSLRRESAIQHTQTMLISGLALSGAILFLGIGLGVSVLPSIGDLIDVIGLIVIGIVSIVGFGVALFKARIRQVQAELDKFQYNKK